MCCTLFAFSTFPRLATVQLWMDVYMSLARTYMYILGLMFWQVYECMYILCTTIVYQVETGIRTIIQHVHVRVQNWCVHTCTAMAYKLAFYQASEHVSTAVFHCRLKLNWRHLETTSEKRVSELPVSLLSWGRTSLNWRQRESSWSKRKRDWLY